VLEVDWLSLEVQDGAHASQERGQPGRYAA